MLLYREEGLVAYDVLHLARILGRSLGADAEHLEISGQQRVALVDLFGNLTSRIGQIQEIVLCPEESALFQQGDRTADAGLADTKLFGNVDRACGSFFCSRSNTASR